MSIFNKSKNSVYKNLVPEAILIAVLTAICYLGVFLYKFGNFSFYKTDSLFIDISLRDILSVNSIALIIVIEILYYSFFLIINRKKNKKMFKWLFPLLFIVIVIVPIFIIFLEKFNFISFLLFLFVFLLVFIFKSKIERKKDPFDYLKDKFGVSAIIFILIIILYCVYCYAIGLYNAKVKTYYSLVYLNQKPFAIISSYDKNFLCLPINMENKTFSKNLLLLTQDIISEKEILIKKEKIGPLKSE